jgi:hypothetical protein
LKALVCLLALLCASAGPLKAQTAERLDALLDSAAVTYAQAAMIVLPAAGNGVLWRVAAGLTFSF